MEIRMGKNKKKKKFNCLELNTVSNEEMHLEGALRLRIIEKLYNTLPSILERFIKNRTIYITTENGITSPAAPEEQLLFKDFEKMFNCCVYHVLRMNTPDGQSNALFCILNNRLQWDLERQALCKGFVFVFVYNHKNRFAPDYGQMQLIKVPLGIDWIEYTSLQERPQKK